MNHNTSRIAVAKPLGFVFLELADILYVSIEKGQTLMHLTDGSEVKSSASLSQISTSLGTNFVRIHNSYLVNIVHIRSLQGGVNTSVTLSNSQKLTISRRRKKELLEHFKII